MFVRVVNIKKFGLFNNVEDKSVVLTGGGFPITRSINLNIPNLDDYTLFKVERSDTEYKVSLKLGEEVKELIFERIDNLKEEEKPSEEATEKVEEIVKEDEKPTEEVSENTKEIKEDESKNNVYFQSMDILETSGKVNIKNVNDDFPPKIPNFGNFTTEEIAIRNELNRRRGNLTSVVKVNSLLEERLLTREDRIRIELERRRRGY
jgi:hypothetical protein|nr:MAG TPA: hypothetical protein [Caudoviricetes sp.]